MWLFTALGFFSVVQKPGDPFLTVRARVAVDLDKLREVYMPELAPTCTKAGTDYPFRATINHENFARGLARLGREIHYGNFKSEVAKKQGQRRSAVYHSLATLLQLEQLPMETKPPRSNAHRRNPKCPSRFRNLSKRSPLQFGKSPSNP